MPDAHGCIGWKLTTLSSAACISGLLFTLWYVLQSAVPKEYIPGVLKGLEESMTTGSLAGEQANSHVDMLHVLCSGTFFKL